MILLTLFYTFAKIGAFSFGGGYAMIPLIQREIVTNHKWLSLPQFIDVIAISQATPGPIAINSATFVGYKIAGFWGSVSATVGVVLPPFIIMFILTRLFLKYRNLSSTQAAFGGIRPAVVALIVAAAVSIFSSSITDFPGAVIALVVFIATVFTKINPIVLLLLSGISGVFIYH
ncbi:MAG: chromate transporter [Firmicutes bacterium]|nr:chromate transporter [Bacillota bacterium]